MSIKIQIPGPQILSRLSWRHFIQLSEVILIWGIPQIENHCSQLCDCSVDLGTMLASRGIAEGTPQVKALIVQQKLELWWEMGGVASGGAGRFRK